MAFPHLTEAWVLISAAGERMPVKTMAAIAVGSAVAVGTGGLAPALAPAFVWLGNLGLAITGVTAPQVATLVVTTAASASAYREVGDNVAHAREDKARKGKAPQ